MTHGLHMVGMHVVYGHAALRLRDLRRVCTVDRLAHTRIIEWKPIGCRIGSHGVGVRLQLWELLAYSPDDQPVQQWIKRRNTRQLLLPQRRPIGCRRAAAALSSADSSSERRRCRESSDPV